MQCPNCHSENPDTQSFCGECGTPLPSMRPARGSGPSEEISASRTKTLQTPLEELTVGSTFARRYQIIEELGKGGMGIVYKVLDKEIKEKLALKLLNPAISTDEKMIERFRNELKLARKISHRNVCRMFDLGEEEGKRYITMEYVPGEDLKSSIRRMGPLNVGKAIFIAKQVCEGLAEAHRLGVVHRDLKPQNIMIDREGNVRIMDFGIARSLEAEGITDARVMIGTPKYMSPEQVEGKALDQCSDLYSLGVILYEMVTGRAPFEGDTALSIALKHKTEAPPDPRELNAQVPLDLSRVILKCMEKEKERRYQRAEELLSELSRIEEEIPTEDRILVKRRPKLETPRKRFQTFVIPGILLFAAAVIIAGYLFFGRFMHNGKPEGEMISSLIQKNSIAVLPFRDLSPKKDQEHFCIGMTESIIRNLHTFRELKVIPLTSALTYQNSDKDVQKIGKELDVANVLEGTIQKEMDNIRVNAQLSNVEEGSIIWTGNYPRKLTGVFELEDDISKSIAEALGVRLVEERYDVTKTKDTSNFEAYEDYKYGRHFERKYYESNEKKDFENCLKSYFEAIKKDPNYALVYWRLGHVYYDRYIREKNEKDFDLMSEYFTKAYEIDQDLAEANMGLGWLYFGKGDNDKAYQYFKRAYEIDPKNVELNFHIGSFLRSIGLYEQAIKYYSRALELEPMPPDFSLWQDLHALCYSYIGKFEEAANYVRKALEIKPDHWLHLNYARQLIMMKKYEDAEIQISKAEKYISGDPSIRHYRAWIFATKGDKKQALELIEDEEYTFLHRVTSIYSLLGMKDEAIKNIKKGIERGLEEVGDYLYSYPFLISNPCYDNLRDDPRFEEILRREKKKYEEKLKKYGDL